MLFDNIKWFFKVKFNDGHYVSLEKTPFGDSSYSSRKIMDWRNRERQFMTQANIYSKGNLPNNWKDIAKEVNVWVHENIEYTSDQELWGTGDYWPTSKEVLEKLKEDCDGQSILKWRMLIDRGFPQDHVGILLVTGHAMVCIYEDLDARNFYIMDNGNLTWNIRKANETFPYVDKELKAAFNITDMWCY